MSPSDRAVSRGGAPRRSGLALFALAFAQLIISLDIYIVFVALPEMQVELGFSDQNLQWVISAYAVVFGGFLLLGGRAADLFGKRNMFLLGLGLYAVSSLVGGFAGDPATIIGARAVQGLGGAVLFPSTLSLINTLFAEGPPRNRALAIWGGAGASGLTLGSLLGGLLTGAFGWASVFFVNVPLAVLVAAIALTAIPATAHAGGGRSFDLPGAVAATAGLTLLVYVLVQGPESGWGSSSIVVSAVLAVVLLVTFIVIEGRTKDPLMPLRLFRNRSLVSAVAITFTFMGTFGTVPYFLTVYFQEVYGFTALLSGVAFLTQSVAIFGGTQIGERIANRTSTKTTLLTGFAIGAIGTAVLAMGTSAELGYGYLVPGLVVMGIGQGIVWTGMWVAAASGVADSEQGVAGGMASTTQQTGYAVGLAIFVAIANAGINGLSGEALRIQVAEGTQIAFYLNAAATVIGFLLALVLPGKAPEAPASSSETDMSTTDVLDSEPGHSTTTVHTTG